MNKNLIRKIVLWGGGIIVILIIIGIIFSNSTNGTAYIDTTDNSGLLAQTNSITNGVIQAPPSGSISNIFNGPVVGGIVDIGKGGVRVVGGILGGFGNFLNKIAGTNNTASKRVTKPGTPNPSPLPLPSDKIPTSPTPIRK